MAASHGEERIIRFSYLSLTEPLPYYKWKAAGQNALQ